MKKLLSVVASCLLFIACNGQKTSQKMENTPVNPLLCDPEKGVCEMPIAENSKEKTTTLESYAAENKVVNIVYFTDPICSSCWGIEPQLRKLKLEYGHLLHIEYRMGGLLPSWDIYNSGGISKPSDVAHHWDEVSAYYEMPIDGNVWLENPLASSYPPSIAFKAAQMQDEQKAVQFMRLIREKVFLEKKNITEWKHLQEAAQAVGLDTAQMHANFANKASKLFEEDLALARKMGVRGFPTLFFTEVATGKQITLYGFKPYQDFVQSLLQVQPKAQAKRVETSWQSLFAVYPTLTAKEFAVLSGQSVEKGVKQLDELVSQQKLRKFDTKNGAIWRVI